jgi:hypothetical protein
MNDPMTITYAIVTAVIAAMVAAQWLADPDPELTAAIRGWYARSWCARVVDAIAAAVGLLALLAAAGLAWLVDELGEHSRQMGALRAGVAPWHA